jgi:hypothetical protein
VLDGTLKSDSAPALPAADLENAQTQCNSGYTPGGFLQLSQTLCLPPYFDACQNVQTAGG